MSEAQRAVVVETSQGKQTLFVLAQQEGLRVTELLRRHGLPLNTRCGQQGVCDGCLIELVEGSLADIQTNQPITAAQAAGPLHGCRHRLEGDAPVLLRIPERSMMAYEPQVLSDFRINIPRAHAPLWRTGDQHHQPTTGSPLGVAIDIGTTTVALLLVELATGKILAKASGFNKQMNLGDDVLTRINLCMNDESLVGRLHEAIVNETLSELLDAAVREAGVQRERVVCLAAAGNATMMHLLADVNPASMGVAPFDAVFLDHRIMPLSQTAFAWPQRHDAPLNGAAPRDPLLHLLPSAAAYIGSDLTAGVIASALLYDQGPSLLVDIGTNGEIILKHHDRMLGCATAAGPAFEGARLTDGVRAGRGAVSHIRLDADAKQVRTEVIGDAKPIGICGSAYIDFLAEGARTGMLSSSGRFQAEPDSPWQKRLMTMERGGRGFRVTRAAGSRPICITESDIATLLQAKAAIAAGIVTLLQRVGMQASEVKTLYLAGGFGMHVNIESAIGAGLLPGFRRDQIELVGNTSLAGAYLALLDEGVVQEMSHVSRSLEVVELNLDPNFESQFIDQLSLGPA
jgi:uncharacterized 2Fe-2S/4Fe-4S cluster protein (DUF4445 family)